MTSKSRIAAAAACIALLSAGYVAGRQQAGAQTQGEMNQSSYRDFQKADKQLNALYSQLIKNYPAQGDFAATHKKIVAAEREWIKYRDLQAYMEASIGGEGGTIYPMAYNMTLTDVTEERIKRLNRILHEKDGL